MAGQVGRAKQLKNPQKNDIILDIVGSPASTRVARRREAGLMVWHLFIF